MVERDGDCRFDWNSVEVDVLEVVPGYLDDVAEVWSQVHSRPHRVQAREEDLAVVSIVEAAPYVQLALVGRYENELGVPLS